MRSLWKRTLRIGFIYTESGLDRGRVMLLNALVFITLVAVTLFFFVYLAIGYQYYYGPLYMVLPCVVVLLLHRKGKFKTARLWYLFAGLAVIAYWVYEGRRNGNEYTLIVLATTSTLIFSSKRMVIISNALCTFVFLLYKYWDNHTPFTPDPSIDYEVMPVLILLLSVAVVSFQVAFFRDLASHYDKKLNLRFTELTFIHKKQQQTEKDLLHSNEEIKRINQKLYQMTTRLEELVKQRTRELQAYIDAINVNMFMFINDLNGNFTFINKPLLDASGFSEEELIGKHFSVLTTERHQALHSRERKDRLYNGHSWRGEVEHIDKNGNLYWFDCVVIPVSEDGRQIKHYLSLGLPVTERKRHAEMKTKTQQMLETIAYRASHNIRGPLARIHGLANLIRKDLVDDTEFKSVAEKFVICSDELNIATAELVKFVYDHHEILLSEKQNLSAAG